MDNLLQDLSSFTAAYIDDTVIHNSNWESHLTHIRAVLERLGNVELTAKPQKCQFAMSRCTYGHVVGNGLVCPEKSKTEAIQWFPRPQTKKKVCAFLGLAGYYRKFIPDFAGIAMVLTDFTTKNEPNQVKWTPECNSAFEKLKELLCAAPVLRSLEFEKIFILQTDASDRGVGAVLSQRSDDGNDHPVAYYSRKLLPCEVRYSTIEKECLAIKLAV